MQNTAAYKMLAPAQHVVVRYQASTVPVAFPIEQMTRRKPGCFFKEPTDDRTKGPPLKLYRVYNPCPVFRSNPNVLNVSSRLSICCCLAALVTAFDDLKPLFTSPAETGYWDCCNNLCTACDHSARVFGHSTPSDFPFPLLPRLPLY